MPCSRGGSGAPPLVGGPSIFERDARAAVGLGEGTGPAPGADALILSSASWALTSLPGHLPGREGRISSRSQRASKEELAGGASLASDLCPPPSSLQRYLLGWRRLIRAGRRFLLRCLQVSTHSARTRVCARGRVCTRVVWQRTWACIRMWTRTGSAGVGLGPPPGLHCAALLLAQSSPLWALGPRLCTEAFLCLGGQLLPCCGPTWWWLIRGHPLSCLGALGPVCFAPHLPQWRRGGASCPVPHPCQGGGNGEQLHWPIPAPYGFGLTTKLPLCVLRPLT